MCVCNILKGYFKALESKQKHTSHVSPQDTNQLLWENKKVNMHWETYNKISQSQTETTVWTSTWIIYIDNLFYHFIKQMFGYTVYI